MPSSGLSPWGSLRLQEGVVHAFAGQGGGLAVTRDHVRFARQGHQLVQDGAHERVVIASGQVRAADAAGKSVSPLSSRLSSCE